MAIDRIVRFTIDPIDTEQMLTTRASLISATRQAYPGLAEARIARIDDQTWIDIWRWDSLAEAQAAIDGALSGSIPEAGAAFALIKEVAAEFAEIIDER